MPDSRFFDTNILVYAFAANDPRRAQAEALMAEGGVIGVQVLNEFTNNAARNLEAFESTTRFLGRFRETDINVRNSQLITHVGRNNRRALRRMWCCARAFGAMRYAY
jgi:predicted nucleic acid-binding protein